MEDIPGYDDWKSTPPDDPEPVTYCSGCGAPLYEGDYLCQRCIPGTERL